MSTDDTTEDLVRAARNGDLSEVQRLIEVVDPKSNNSAALQMAASQGHAEIVKLLIPVSDPLAYQSNALLMALDNKHAACVELLAAVSNVHHGHFYAASETGCWACFQPLINTEHNPELIQQAFVRAARFGHLGLMQHLMERVDPKYKDSLALKWALMGEHHACVEVLYPVSDPQVVVQYFDRSAERAPGFLEPLKQRMEADRLRGVLSSVVNQTSVSYIKKM